MPATRLSRKSSAWKDFKKSVGLKKNVGPTQVVRIFWDEKQIFGPTENLVKKIGGQKTVLVQKKFEEKSQNDRGLIASKLYGCLHHGIRHEFQC